MYRYRLIQIKMHKKLKNLDWLQLILKKGKSTFNNQYQYLEDNLGSWLMVRLSKIIKSGSKSRKEQLQRKIKLLERGHSYRDIFLTDRKQLDKHLAYLEISEQKTNIWLLRRQINQLSEQLKAQISEIQQTQRKFRQRTIELVRSCLNNALISNERFNEEVKEFIKSSNLDPFDFDEFWDVVMKDFIEVYLKELPEFILTSSVLIDFWQERLNEKSKEK